MSLSKPIKPPNYEAIEKLQWLKNAEKVPVRLAEGEEDLMKRINTYMKRFGYKKSEVRDKINSDSMFAAHFAKEPRRTSIHEKIASKWLTKHLSNFSFRKLSPSGSNALYISREGQIMPSNLARKPSKSLDFTWKIKEHTFYAMHKYTKEDGGHQSSQFREMQDLLSNFQRSQEKNVVLIVIVDGPYYNENRMHMLNQMTRGMEPKSFACHIEDIPEIIKDYL